jgi:hypothetical protein
MRARASRNAGRLLRGNALTYVLLLLIVIPGQALWLFRGLDAAEQLGIEAVVIAVAAVVVAVRHANGLETVTDELRGVARSVPTRGIGVFPDYMSEVAELVGRASESITILCDTPAHAAFSNTAAFTKYWDTLRHMMVDRVTIECTFIDDPGRKQMHRAQIAGDAKNWHAWKERNRANCAAFDQLARSSGVEPLSSMQSLDPVETWANTPDVYVQSMVAINDAVLSTFGRVQPELLDFSDPLHEGPSVYFWLRDHDQEAVFVIVPVRGIGVRDLAGFHTREPALIRALDTVYEHRGESQART